MYVTKSEIKTFLGWSGTSQDDRIDALIPVGENILNSILGVDDITSQTYTDEITRGRGQEYLDLKNYPVTSVTTIKSVGLSSDLELTNISMRRIRGRRVYFDTTFTEGSRYLITYVAGQSVTDEIKYAMSLLVAGMIEKAENSGVESYKILSKTVVFRDVTDAEQFENIISTYLANYRGVGVLVV